MDMLRLFVPPRRECARDWCRSSKNSLNLALRFNIMYVKFDQLIDKIKELVILGRDMIVLKDQGKAEKAAIVISGVINPALDGLKIYRTIGSRNLTKEDEIEADIYYKIDRARSSDHFPTATVFQHPFNS
jgi:hypothetical protein